MERFVVTDELGRLGRWLRILGFDTVVEKDKRELVIKSLREERIILTRDSKMSRFTGTRMVKIESDFVEEQLEQLIRQLKLKIDKDSLFTICAICNEELKKTGKASVRKIVPKYVFETQRSFMKCPKCKRVYWQGTHWALVQKFLEKISV